MLKVIKHQQEPLVLENGLHLSKKGTAYSQPVPKHTDNLGQHLGEIIDWR